MSKKKLIELLQMNDHDLEYAIFDFVLPDDGLDDFRSLISSALKEQDRDTRNGCAEAMLDLELKISVPRPSDAHAACLNYQDKDLAGL